MKEKAFWVIITERRVEWGECRIGENYRITHSKQEIEKKQTAIEATNTSVCEQTLQENQAFWRHRLFSSSCSYMRSGESHQKG